MQMHAKLALVAVEIAALDRQSRKHRPRRAQRSVGAITEVFRGGWIADYADPSSFLDLFISDNNLNNTFYKSADFDLLMKSAEISSGSARMELLRQAEAQLIRDMPVVPLYYYVSLHLVRPRVTGFTDNIRDVHLSRYLGVISENP